MRVRSVLTVAIAGLLLRRVRIEREVGCAGEADHSRRRRRRPLRGIDPGH